MKRSGAPRTLVNNENHLIPFFQILELHFAQPPLMKEYFQSLFRFDKAIPLGSFNRLNFASIHTRCPIPSAGEISAEPILINPEFFRNRLTQKSRLFTGLSGLKAIDFPASVRFVQSKSIIVLNIGRLVDERNLNVGSIALDLGLTHNPLH
jgi:hypothetical protein